jgi:hypothetical protein
VFYLHIYYQKDEGLGKDDMFSHAVHHLSISCHLNSSCLPIITVGCIGYIDPFWGMFALEPKLTLPTSWHTRDFWLLFGWVQFFFANPAQSMHGSAFFTNVWVSQERSNPLPKNWPRQKFGRACWGLSQTYPYLFCWLLPGFTLPMLCHFVSTIC